jgi:hypothetical protein
MVAALARRKVTWCRDGQEWFWEYPVVNRRRSVGASPEGIASDSLLLQSQAFLQVLQSPISRWASHTARYPGSTVLHGIS